MFSQSRLSPSACNSLKAALQSVIGRTIFSISVISTFVLAPISMATSQTLPTSSTQLQTPTTKTQLLAQFPHHTSASSTLGFLVTNYSVYCQTNGSETMDILTVKPLCGGVGEGEVAPQFRVDNTPILLTTPLEPIVLFQNDKAILLLSDL